jgi:hypothetical protein
MVHRRNRRAGGIRLLPSTNYGDRQTNWIKSHSSVRRKSMLHRRHRRPRLICICYHRATMVTSVRRQSMLHLRHRRHPLPSSNHGDGQTNLIKFIPFVCPSPVHASPIHRRHRRHPLPSRYHRATKGTYYSR